MVKIVYIMWLLPQWNKNIFKNIKNASGDLEKNEASEKWTEKQTFLERENWTQNHLTDGNLVNIAMVSPNSPSLHTLPHPFKSP